MEGPIAIWGRALDRWFRRWMPDPFTLALGLTLLVALSALVSGQKLQRLPLVDRVATILSAWQQHLFEPRRPDGSVNEGNLYFAFQMCVMLVTGHALATSPPMSRAVAAVARLPSSPRAATALVAFSAVFMALVHWALGITVGALLARAVGEHTRERGVRVHYPLLVAAGYSGMMVWGGGLSGSIPLKALDYRPSESIAARFPYESGIPLAETLWSPLNLVVCILSLLLIPVVAACLHPSEDVEVCATRPSAEMDETHPAGGAASMGWVWRTENSRAAAWLVAGLGSASLLQEAWQHGFSLTFNTLNTAFLFFGIGAHGSLLRYVRAVGVAARGCAGIILQFPFYFAILGILLASGLVEQVSAAVVAVSSDSTYPIVTFLSAGFVNLFVPSGGGQWVVQGEIVIRGALEWPEVLGKSVLALAYGDGWTNMLQPFWALPVLAITGLSARRIIGYTAVLMGAGGVWIGACLLVF